MKAEISQQGTWQSKWVCFKAESDKPIKVEDAVTAQIRLGYLPQGYGFYCFESDALKNGTFTATWKCSRSCE